MFKKIQIEDLSYRYSADDKNVLEDLQLEIPNDEIISILGNNGSGKTTFLLALLKRILPNTGSVRYQNEQGREEDNIIVGYLPQIEKLPYGYTVHEYVLLGRFPFISLFKAPSKEDEMAAEEALRALNIDGMRGKFLHELSGGELQKVRIARLLTQKADILLMDEPANHLDLKNRRELLQIIKRIKDSTKAIVFTTHDPNDAIEIADRVLILKEGRIVVYDRMEAALKVKHLQEAFEIPFEIQKINSHLYITTKNDR